MDCAYEQIEGFSSGIKERLAFKIGGLMVNQINNFEQRLCLEGGEL